MYVLGQKGGQSLDPEHLKKTSKRKSIFFTCLVKCCENGSLSYNVKYWWRKQSI
jgi:hypothetical protein